MLIISPTLRANLESFDVVTNILVRIDFSTPILYTDASYDIDFNLETYIPGPIASVSPPKAEGQINRDIFEIVLDDPDYTVEQMLITDPSGVDTEVHLRIGTEFLPVYAGKTSNFSSSIQEGADGIVNRITIASTGPLAKLYQISNRTTTRASQEQLYPSDNGFNYSYDSQNEATLKWGGL